MPDSTKWDVTIESPEGRLFRNRQELSRHFEEARLEHNLDLFEFGLEEDSPDMEGQSASGGGAGAAEEPGGRQQRRLLQYQRHLDEF